MLPRDGIFMINNDPNHLLWVQKGRVLNGAWDAVAVDGDPNYLMPDPKQGLKGTFPIAFWVLEAPKVVNYDGRVVDYNDVIERAKQILKEQRQ